MLLLVILQLNLMIDGLPDGTIHWQETGDYQYEIALGIEGEIVSQWTAYPLFFNPAKSYCRYNDEDLVLELSSQRPFSAEYTFAHYRIGDDMSLELLEYGDGNYYETAMARVENHLEAGDMDEAVNAAYDIMYPGAMPYPEEFCALFVIAAAEIGTLEAFQQASEITANFLWEEIHQIDCDSQEYLDALLVYADLADSETAAAIKERMFSNE